MTASSAGVSAARSGRHPTVPRRRWLAWLIVLLMIAAVGVATALIVAGSRSVLPPPAPVPAHPYSAARPPVALLPGDIVPPSTGSVTAAGPVGGAAAGGSGGGVAGPISGVAGQNGSASGGVSGGSDTAPPRHVGPWTFDGANRLFVQSLGIDAQVLPVGTDGGGLTIPADVRQVGKWTGGADIDDKHGTVLIAGHVSFVGQGEGALYNLYTVQQGAVVVTTDSKGVRTSWRVIALDSIDKKALPAGIFTRNGPRRLVLVTCGGNLLHIDGPNGGYNTYQNNTLAYAVPAT